MVSDPGVSCLLLLPTKLEETNSLTCRKGKTSDPSQFLTLVGGRGGRRLADRLESDMLVL